MLEQEIGICPFDVGSAAVPERACTAYLVGHAALRGSDTLQACEDDASQVHAQAGVLLRPAGAAYTASVTPSPPHDRLPERVGAPRRRFIRREQRHCWGVGLVVIAAEPAPRYPSHMPHPSLTDGHTLTLASRTSV